MRIRGSTYPVVWDGMDVKPCQGGRGIPTTVTSGMLGRYVRGRWESGEAVGKLRDFGRIKTW